ncbi:hypothetical protein BDQ12DRAFT_734567 [Crucibulum laeve]|uniref:Uncharacterized protein n=1 Tax=Crucibulum laeve TaxID=68775 RepID=A0A5C3M338_9AGAR|nr:hypothetical protein BDQ12DRAFT_734567 [Crucibulum laeve]
MKTSLSPTDGHISAVASAPEDTVSTLKQVEIATSAGGQDVIDVQTGSSGRAEARQSVASKTREKKLREDSMVLVLSPYSVECKNCGARIKLSTKSYYDLSHWLMHRARCLKKNKVKGKSSPPKSSSLRRDITPSPYATHSTSTSSSSSPIPVLVTAPKSPPPPLRSPPDTDPEEVVETQPSSTLQSSPPNQNEFRPVIRQINRPTDKHRERSESDHERIRARTPPIGHWKDWSWSRLTLPDFVFEQPRSGGHREIEAVTPGEVVLRNDAAQTLAFLSRPRAR